jgi:hypothetical protein
VHLGLGDSRAADSIEIRWPSGRVQRMANVPANRVVKIREE